MKRKQPIDIKKILLYPTLIVISLLIFAASFAFNYLIQKVENMVHDNAITTTQLLSSRITDNQAMRDQVMDDIDDEMLSIAYIVLQNRNQLNNNYLLQLTQHSDITDIYFYDANGEVLYDANNEYVGWTAEVGDPIHQFMVSGYDEFVEEIRKSTDDDRYYKFVYVRDIDGYFVQVGVLAEQLVAMIATYEYQHQIELFKDEYTIIYSLTLIDNTYEVVASDQPEQIGQDVSGQEIYMAAMLGETVSRHVGNTESASLLFEVVTPIYQDNQVVSIMVIQYSRMAFVETRKAVLSLFITLAVSIILLYFIFQYFQVVQPIQKLNRYIQSIDIYSAESTIPHPKNDPIHGLYQTIDDILERTQTANNRNMDLQKSLEKLAYYDYLTGLPNRLSFYHVVDTNIQIGRYFAILYLDLDDFKTYNDTKGHSFGDRILKSISEKMSQLINDEVYVARHGGDEFLIMYHYHTKEDLDQFIARIRDIFENSLYLDDEPYMMGYSLGVALYPEDGTTAEELIRKADVAMYFVKKVEENLHMYYDESMDKQIEENAKLVTILKTAIKENHFYMVYQPQVNIQTQEVIGLEALLRLKDSALSPGVFILVAEQSGLIGTIGRLVLRMVIEQVANWKKQLSMVLPVSINLSSKQLDDSNLVDYISNLLQEYTVSPGSIQIEVTESAIIEKGSRAIMVLAELKAMGIATSIDDFGSGQSGINYLTQFHVNQVKLDKSFVDKYLNTKWMEVFNTVVHLCHLMEFEVLAEGIETVEQVTLLKKTECKLAQGYYYYRPLTVETIESLLLSQETRKKDI